MKTKTVVAAALMSAFLFMGQTCSTGGIVIPGSSVISGVQQLCGITVPLVDIAALVAANPALTSVAAVVDAICAAFKAQQAAHHGQTAAPSGWVIVDGVLVHWTVHTPPVTTH